MDEQSRDLKVLPWDFAIVSSGGIQSGDYIWTAHRGWSPVEERWIGFHAVVFGPTARPTGGRINAQP